jgi:hypothetical protein
LINGYSLDHGVTAAFRALDSQGTNGCVVKNPSQTVIKKALF